MPVRIERWRPLCVDHGRGHEIGAAGPGQETRCPYRVLLQDALRRGFVEGYRDEPAHRAERKTDEQCPDLFRVIAEVADGTKLARFQPQLPHLRQDALSRQHDAPPRHFADAPRYGCSGQTLDDASLRRFHLPSLLTHRLGAAQALSGPCSPSDGNFDCLPGLARATWTCSGYLDLLGLPGSAQATRTCSGANPAHEVPAGPQP